MLRLENSPDGYDLASGGRLDGERHRDPEAEANGWHLSTMILDIAFKNGTKYLARVAATKGGASIPLTEEGAADKFGDCAAYAGMQ